MSAPRGADRLHGQLPVGGEVAEHGRELATGDDGHSATIGRMPMLCLAGAFHVTGTEPDGDSVRFRPTDPADWDQVPGPTAVRRNASGAAQLRLDAIDALETHYTPAGGKLVHQPLELAHAAAAELLAWLGFTDVVRSGETVKSVAADDQPGFILTRGADVYGRCVALVGRGAAPGSGMINVDVALLRQTVNHHLITTGLAYPTFYTKLYADLRNELATQAAAARAARSGVFAGDLTQSGVTVDSLATLTDDAVILPKLFRRLADYLHLNGDDLSLSGFKAFLAQQADTLWVIPTSEKTTLDSLVTVDGPDGPPHPPPRGARVRREVTVSAPSRTERGRYPRDRRCDRRQPPPRGRTRRRPAGRALLPFLARKTYVASQASRLLPSTSG